MTPISTQTTPPTQSLFVAASEVMVPEAGRDALDAAFVGRLGAVGPMAPFPGLQMWADITDPSSLMTISWWDNQDRFANDMRFEDHRRLHRPILGQDTRPRPRRFEVTAR